MPTSGRAPLRRADAAANGTTIGLIARDTERLEWIKPVLDTGPQDVANALALSIVATSAAVRTVAVDTRRRGRGTLLFTTGGTAVEPHRDRAVSGIAHAAESAYIRMLHDALGDERVYAAQLTVVGPISHDARHEPDAVADELWQLHTRHDQPLLVPRWRGANAGAGPSESARPGTSLILPRITEVGS